MLDFGLAKAWSGDATASGRARRRSRSPRPSRTPAPRPASSSAPPPTCRPSRRAARPVDKRADIWAFGVVLYEMLTGRRLFDGETVSDVLAAVLTREPDFAALPPTTPAHVAALLRRCLERDPHDRLQSIGDARIALQGGPVLAPAHAVPGGRPPAPVLGLGALGPRRASRRRPRRSLASARPRRRTSVTAAIPPPPGTAFDLRGRGPGPVAFSPDGSRVAFAAQAQDAATLLYVRAIADGRVTEYPGSAGRAVPVLVAGRALDRLLLALRREAQEGPRRGGSAAHDLPRPRTARAAAGAATTSSCSPRPRATALHRVPASGGEPVPFTQLARPVQLAPPPALPAGRATLPLPGPLGTGRAERGPPRVGRRLAAAARSSARRRRPSTRRATSSSCASRC